MPFLMELIFLWPGKTKNQHLRALQEEFLSRLQPFCRARIVETAEARGLKRASPAGYWKRKPGGLKSISRMAILSAFQIKEK